MDLSDTIAPKSDQLDAVDLLSGPRMFTIERASKGSAEQPVNLHLAEFSRPWRPGVNMRRVIVGLWGKETDAYVGRRVILYCDTGVKFGGVEVGGVRISHMSDIGDEPRKVPLIVGRGKGGVWNVQPITETDIRVEDLRTEYRTADEKRRKEIEAEVAKLQKGGE